MERIKIQVELHKNKVVWSIDKKLFEKMPATKVKETILNMAVIEELEPRF